MKHSTITVTDLSDTLQTRVWIGCLACYAAGDLVGNWYPATDADSVTTEALHQDASQPCHGDHDELWVMDHEHLPIQGECSPHVATAWASLLDELDELDEWERLPFNAWVRDASTYWCDGDGLPSLNDFRDAYAGEWESLSDYAADLLDQTGELELIPERLRGYFDLDAFSRDLAYDLDIVAGCGGCVWIFNRH